jgi:hypothetical protein
LQKLLVRPSYSKVTISQERTLRPPYADLRILDVLTTALRRYA